MAGGMHGGGCVWWGGVYGGHAWLGVCVWWECMHAGGMCGGGYMRGGGHVWQGERACMVGSMHGRGHAWHTRSPPPYHKIQSVNEQAVHILLECILVFKSCENKVLALKVCSHLTSAIAFASTSRSKFNIASMVTQTQMHRMGLNPFSASMLT